jgi:hypothetical protein
MKYFHTTLAINEPYFKNSLNFFISLHEKTEHGYYNITTSKEDLNNFFNNTGLTIDEFKKKYPKILITTVEDLNTRFKFPLEMEGHGFIFNLNLKVLSIKAAQMSNIEFDYLIFSDGDWNIYDGFEESKLFNMFQYMEDNGIDFGFERPAKIGDYKKNNLQDCFFLEKLIDYGADKHDIWDESDVVNEQYLVFKNNSKLMLFEQKWEQMLWYSIANNIRNYPDGFEIGVAALESKMVRSIIPLKLLSNCYYFYPKYTEHKHIRF